MRQKQQTHLEVTFNQINRRIIFARDRALNWLRAIMAGTATPLLLYIRVIKSTDPFVPTRISASII